MVLSTFTGTTTSNVTALINTQPKIENSSYKVVKDISNKEIENLMGTEEYIRQYFKDIPIMIQIAKCESTFRQLDNQGNVIKNKNSSATGVLQIMASIHTPDAEELGLDIKTLEGNAAFARDLYERQGTKPWNASKACWGKYVKDSSNEIAINK